MGNTYFQKKKIRAEIKSARALISPEEKKALSDKIAERLISLPEFKKAQMVFSYVPLKNEVDTAPIINEALRLHKRVAVPRCREGQPLMDFYYIKSLSELESGSYGIKEPTENADKLCTELDGICILPGLSFDRLGSRLGYGKGYYDRFLKKFKGETIGVCFAGLLQERPLPTGKFDIPVNCVVTDRETIRIPAKTKVNLGETL